MCEKSKIKHFEVAILMWFKSYSLCCLVWLKVKCEHQCERKKIVYQNMNYQVHATNTHHDSIAVYIYVMDTCFWG